MKKLYILSLSLVASMSFGQTINFAGSGELTANGWAQTGTPTAPATDFPGHLAILETASDSGNSLSYSGLAASSGNRTTTTHNNTQDANFPVGPYTGVTYYSALIKATNTNGMFLNTNVAGEYFIHLSASAGTGSATFVGRVYVKKGVAENTFVLGVLNNSGGSATPSFGPTEYVTNQTYFIVVKYDIATNTASLYVNPTPGAAEPTSTANNNTGTGNAPAQIAAINLRQSGGVTAANSTGNIEIDEIRIADNWAAVTPQNLGVNDNAIAGLKVYPNPLRGNTLFIDTTANAEKTVVVYDVLGKVVLNTKVSSNSVNVSKLNGGVYIVKITEEGNTATRKLVIK